MIDILKKFYTEDKDLTKKAAKVLGFKILAKKVSKNDLNKLIRLYSVKLYANELANIKIAQKASDRFFKYYAKLQAKYPDYDTSSPTFWKGLKNMAEKDWKNRTNKGSGVDW